MLLYSIRALRRVANAIQYHTLAHAALAGSGLPHNHAESLSEHKDRAARDDLVQRVLEVDLCLIVDLTPVLARSDVRVRAPRAVPHESSRRPRPWGRLRACGTY